MDSLEQLLAREAIKDLKARYCRFLDTKDWDGLAALFLEDAILDVEQDTGNPPIHGRDALMEQIRFAVIHAASSHQVHTPEITLTSVDRATGIWAMQDRVVWQEGHSPIPGVGAITGYGQYHETYRRTADGWQIAALRLSRFHVDIHPA